MHKLIDRCIFHLSYAQPTLRSILRGETESFFKVRNRGRDWDIWPLEQEDMVKILLLSELGTEGAYASVKCYAYMPVCKYAELKYTSCNKSLLLLVEHYVSD